MTVNLSPVGDLSLSTDITDTVDYPYCGNCTHISADGSSGSYCTHYDEQTRIEPGFVCPAYLPSGMEYLADEPNE
ncbi:hypothetical protein [Haloarcula laminariae]|uniref:hypothetical protein n=1 Tax=Haloarcula laminariae TaxID=2961577 RepID=UPI0024073FC3|nr:hypothetical protein [Halomicroarcula sp. FL173]